MKTNTVYTQKWPLRSLFPEETVLFYDAKIANKPAFKTWKKNFRFQFALQAGESLKTLDSLSAVLKKLSQQKIPQTTNLTFIAVGGGSVGDFVGFLASIFSRGRKFVQIPSTWLAAIDSAHGGKNGLNFQGAKNQLGTFYSADQVFIVEEILKSQPAERFSEALGEVIKVGIINSKSSLQKLEKKENNFSHKDLLQLLPELIQGKMQIVEKDPFEKNDIRRVLNLGHTMGHVFESHFHLAHGEAVKIGILFSARWSLQRKIIKAENFLRIDKILNYFPAPVELKSLLKTISLKQVKELLEKDKKSTKIGYLDFIFIQSIGHVVRKKVSIESILDEIQRQKMES